MGYREQAIVFPCEGETLVGILALPTGPTPPSEVGLVVIVGGPQYRVGSHRQFLDLSRRIAAAGIAVLRFDVRGMGDSTGALRTFETIAPDIASAIDALQRFAPHVHRVALWGLCDGASAALLYAGAHRDVRIHGLCLLNPWVRSEASLARAHIKHYYRQRLQQREFWLKLFSGRVAGQTLASLWRSIRTMCSTASKPGSDHQKPFQQRMARTWREFNRPILLILSGEDYTAKEFLEYVAMDKSWAGLLNNPHVLRCDLRNADHTFSRGEAKAQVEAQTLVWLQSKVAV